MTVCSPGTFWAPRVPEIYLTGKANAQLAKANPACAADKMDKI